MKKINIFLIFIIIVGFIVSGSIANAKPPKSFDWESKSPFDLIILLKNNKTSSYMVARTHKNWVKKKHLTGLVKLIDSSERCANVFSMWSSYLDSNWSTVGNEAAYLIEGYRDGQYPHGLNSTRPKPDRENILKWWQNFRQISEQTH